MFKRSVNSLAKAVSDPSAGALAGPAGHRERPVRVAIDGGSRAKYPLCGRRGFKKSAQQQHIASRFHPEQGIVVSDHGGRQVNGANSPLRALSASLVQAKYMLLMQGAAFCAVHPVQNGLFASCAELMLVPGTAKFRFPPNVLFVRPKAKRERACRRSLLGSRLNHALG